MPKKTPKPAPVDITAPTPAASDTPPPQPDDTPRYTWAEIRAKVKPATESDLAVYAVQASAKALVEDGANIDSVHILTDLRLWIGQLYDWWSKLSAERKRAVIGFSDARLRAVTHHALRLLDLSERSNHSDTVKIEQAAAVARANAAYAQGQTLRRTLTAVLIQAASADTTFKPEVDASDKPADNAVALQQTLRNLVATARKALKAGNKVGHVLAADNLTEEALAQFETLIVTIGATHGDTRGSASSGPVTKAELNQQDGVCLAFMRGLRAVTKVLREDDPTVPVLIPRATASVFGMGRKKKTAKPVSGGESPVG